MTLTVVKTTALTGTITNAQLAGGIDLTSKVTGTLPIANGGTNSTATTFVNATTNVTGALPIVNGGTGATSFSPGKIGQVVTANIGGSDVTTTSTSYSDLVTINITPSATSSSIYIIVSGNYNLFGNNSTSEPQGFLSIRNSSNSELTRAQAFDQFRNDSLQHETGLNITYYVSPNSTSQQTFKLSFKNTVATGRFRMLHNATRITAMEVLA